MPVTPTNERGRRWLQRSPATAVLAVVSSLSAAFGAAMAHADDGPARIDPGDANLIYCRGPMAVHFRAASGGFETVVVAEKEFARAGPYGGALQPGQCGNYTGTGFEGRSEWYLTHSALVAKTNAFAEAGYHLALHCLLSSDRVFIFSEIANNFAGAIHCLPFQPSRARVTIRPKPE